METTIVTALAGIAGSLCGGSASVATAWLTQKTRNKRERIRAEVKKREALYGEFINECSQRVMDSLARNALLAEIYKQTKVLERVCLEPRIMHPSETGLDPMPATDRPAP